MMSVCESCRFEMAERRATDAAPYMYRLGGEWRLSGITFYQCPKCKAEAPVIPRVAQLHRLMAKLLVEKAGPLTGPEIKFLRKSAGFPAQDFASLLGVTPSYLSRVENGAVNHENLGASADKLAKLLATGGPAIEGLRQLAQLKKRQKRPVERKFRLIGGGWRAA